MRSIGVLALLGMIVPLVALADPPQQGLPKEELAKFQGKWQMVKQVRDGTEITAADYVNAGLTSPICTFDGNSYTWSGSDSAGKIERLGRTGKRTTVDYRNPRGNLELAIYEFDGDTFRDCMAPPDGERPTSFDAPSGSGRVLVIYRRVK